MQRVHQVIHDGPGVVLVNTGDSPQEITVSIFPNYRGILEGCRSSGVGYLVWCWMHLPVHPIPNGIQVSKLSVGRVTALPYSRRAISISISLRSSKGGTPYQSRSSSDINRRIASRSCSLVALSIISRACSIMAFLASWRLYPPMRPSRL